MKKTKETGNGSLTTALTFVFIIFLAGGVSASQCNDGADNDLDGEIDYPADSGCLNVDDNSESVVLSYANGCLNDDEKLYNVFGQITYECEHDTCNVCVSITEAGNYTTIPSRCDDLPPCGFGGGDGGDDIDTSAPNLTINSPVDGEIYTSKKILINLESTERARIQYKINDENWKSICDNCDDYSSTKNFVEGLNDVTFKAEDDGGNVGYASLTLRVDSQAPKIVNTEPKEGFASGEFFVEFKEENPDELKLHYGNFESGTREYEVNIETECEENDGKFECITSVNLSDYNGETIEYWFELMDIADNTDESNAEELIVDYSDPMINSLDILEMDEHNGISGTKVTFVIDINEPNLEEVLYRENNEANPKWKKLCSSLTNEICEKKVSVKDGQHNVDVQVVDKSGRSTGTSIEFYSDSKKPKIKKVEPNNGFASGMFHIKFEEMNPESLVLEYGNSGTGMSEHNLDIMNECDLIGKYYECWSEVDVSDYEEEEIEYAYTLLDKVGNFAMSGVNELIIDTTAPVIEEISYTLSGNKAEITVPINEENFDMMKYRINGGSWKTFCSSLKSGACKKKLTLSQGNNEIEFEAYDEAGNAAEDNIEISL